MVGIQEQTEPLKPISQNEPMLLLLYGSLGYVAQIIYETNNMIIILKSYWKNGYKAHSMSLRNGPSFQGIEF